MSLRKASPTQYISIDPAIKPYLKTIDYTVDGCLRAANVASWSRFFDFNKDDAYVYDWEVRLLALCRTLLLSSELGSRLNRHMTPWTGHIQLPRTGQGESR